jgi:predicted ATP-dependent endonuclease of OLD family
MKISAFQIKNYRSIVDSGRCYLSPDYITALIGQNESGKTSVLEALRSFYEGSITDDILRSDLTFPDITCTFQFEEKTRPSDFLNLSSFPDELQKAISSKTEISITRKWLDSRKNIIAINEPEISSFFQLLEQERNEREAGIAAAVSELGKQAELSARNMEYAENMVSIARSDLNAIYSRSEQLKRTVNKAKAPDGQITAQQELESCLKQLADAETNLKEQLINLEDSKNKMQLLAEKISVCKQVQELSVRVMALKEEFKIKSSLLLDAEHQYEIRLGERELKTLGKQLIQLKESRNLTADSLGYQNIQLFIRQRVAEKGLAGKKLYDAEQEAIHEQDVENSYPTSTEMGEALFKKVPMFEFFEDFSSLLPNKIDLEDLLSENIHAEGYKAARNFLYVAGLNADFFREKNHRILKQKIENLNSEITIDFQDYWRQSVGKDDKIRIHFELEHYDNTHPEKSGKPYLEFWIKDKQERLYPKQRSRGVRWFLSFYLELKATAKSNSVDRVMLIDEPGLSLHARAQEDVLKVFEDLRENLQIIYCTHSPNLIDLKKLYRIIAVQRARDTDEKSETLILDARSLSEASSDTLSPIYALMGTRLNDRQFIFPRNNLIVEDAITFHYLDVMAKLYGLENQVHFIPSNGTDHMPAMANVLFGWKVDFGILIADTPAGVSMIDFLKATTFYPHPEFSDKRILLMQGFPWVEDLFSAIDLKRFIIQQRAGITIRNSEYITNNNLSRIILASDFISKIQKEGVLFSDFDDETKNNFENLFTRIKTMTEPI